MIFGTVASFSEPLRPIGARSLLVNWCIVQLQRLEEITSVLDNLVRVFTMVRLSCDRCSCGRLAGQWTCCHLGSRSGLVKLLGWNDWVDADVQPTRECHWESRSKRRPLVLYRRSARKIRHLDLWLTVSPSSSWMVDEVLDGRGPLTLYKASTPISQIIRSFSTTLGRLRKSLLILDTFCFVLIYSDRSWQDISPRDLLFISGYFGYFTCNSIFANFCT